MRRLLVVAGTLVLLVGAQLFVLPERTERYFAWTIKLPLTAAFLGAGYLASVPLEWLAAREREWVRVRVAVSGVFAFTVLTLVATLVHLELFHLDARLPLATRAVTWVWIGVYAVVPAVLAVLWLAQRRVLGEDPPRQAPLPAWTRALIGAQAAVMLVLGAILFIDPVGAAPLWPWPLTPLTSRAIGAWALGMGVAAAHSVWENDFLRVRVASASYVVIGLLQLVAVARYPAPLDPGVHSALYLAFLVSMVLVGGYGWAGARRAAHGGSSRVWTQAGEGEEERVSEGTERAKEALRRDWEQTKADVPGLEGTELDQDVDDTVNQAMGQEPIPPPNQPNPDG